MSARARDRLTVPAAWRFCFMFGNAMRLGFAGFFATAITFGPAQVGYGLFLPWFRDEFTLSTPMLGLIGSGLSAGYLSAVAAAGLLTARFGPRPLVLVGLSLAAIGMSIVALSSTSWMLAIGVVIAGTAAGLTWSPYNDAAEYMVQPEKEERVLTAVSTGTTLGILLAALTAYIVGEDWRLAWGAFVVAAAVVAVPNLRVVPSGHLNQTELDGVTLRDWWRWLVRRDSMPLFVSAAMFGVMSSFYFSFAVDLVVNTGGLAVTVAGPVVFASIGAGGFPGLISGDAIRRLSLRSVLIAGLGCLGVAALLLGMIPSAWPAIILSAALFGLGVMVVSAVYSVWSTDIFRDESSTGFSATLLAFGIGMTIGPTLFSFIGDVVGLDIAFLIASGVILLTALLRPVDVSK